MVHISKRKKEFGKVFEAEKKYTLDEALSQVEKFPKVKFDETVELHFRLNLDAILPGTRGENRHGDLATNEAEPARARQLRARGGRRSALGRAAPPVGACARRRYPRAGRRRSHRRVAFRCRRRLLAGRSEAA